MDDLLPEFLTETSESLQLLDVEIVNLEKNPNDVELLSNIFRLVHTIKGTCGFLGLPRLEAVAHAAENVLSRYRDQEIEVTAPGITAILDCLDLIKDILAYLEEHSVEPEGNDQELIDRLNTLAEGNTPEEAPKTEAQPVVESEIEQPTDDINAPVDQEVLAEPTPPAQPTPAPKPFKKEAAKEETKEKPVTVNTSIRVTVDLLEDLMTRVGELVLARNQLLQMVRGESDSRFHAPLQRLNQVTTEIQEKVMKTRMQPIGTAWTKIPRIIRDLSNELGKKIELEMKGEDTELDRQVIEIIKDPLTHMIRNSADHGIEMPDARLAAGKKEAGTIHLNAYHKGGHIIIEINDDGKGIGLERVANKAVENGLVTEEKLEALTDKEILQYVFKPGFSTAEKVTNVSGRGVGMDVVRTNIEKIGGTVELDSVEGQGTKFTIKIPLTLAIVSALIVESQHHRFAVPQINVTELVKVGNQSESTLEYIDDLPVLRLRDTLLPIVSLSDVLNIDHPFVRKDDEAEGGQKTDHDGEYIIVTQVGASLFGIQVDRIYDTEEIVVKPVSPTLKNISVFSGNTILGDGKVVMILDPNGLVSYLDDFSNVDQSKDEKSDGEYNQSDKISFVVFTSGEGNKNAVPLDQITRLEKIVTKDIEFSKEALMVQYRGKLMPLITMDGYRYNGEKEFQSVIVFTQGENFIGLMVEEIDDIIEDRLDLNLSSAVDGYIGTAVINGFATDLIDVSYYLSGVCASWFGSIRSEVILKDKITIPKKVLLIDDSLFFRNLLCPVLHYAGYEVTAVSGAQQAFNLYDEGYDFDVIISDIEMPDMSGFEFAKSLRETDGKWQELPLYALSAHKTDKNVDKSKEAGFDSFIAKCDKDELLDVLHKTFDVRGAA